MEKLSTKLNFDASARELPPEVVEVALEASRKIKDPDKAREAYDKLSPLLEHFRPNQSFTMACGILIEKQRNVEGMLDLWRDLSETFPENLMPLRMMMRWYRRQRRVEEGVNRLHALFPTAQYDVEQAESATIGFAELKVYDEIDQLMASVLPRYPDARSIRMRYIKVLNEQSRFLDAKAVADTVRNADKMGQSSQDLLNLVERRAHKMERLFSSDASDIFERIVSKVPKGDAAPFNAFGSIVFFTGQLGAGGAERQLTRLATSFQRRYQEGATAGGLALTAPIDVAVRHASPASGGDFFLPKLREARVRTAILAEQRDVKPQELRRIAPEILSLMELLPEDIYEHTRKLIPYFQERQTQVAYLWQDGGILSSAVAALLAKVPRIVTSFRGLPPNLRPNLNRPELAPLYKALSTLPQVTFSANSGSTARAYEQWLELPDGFVQVIPNASPPITADGSAEDKALWSTIERKSSRCSKTVLGIFRFDENKRPDMWVEVAAHYVSRNPDTRFVIIGNGYMHADCAKRIAELGLENRIFLIGLQSNVGFFLHKADLLMHLARMEGLPNALIEAHLAGVPVLATPAGGTSEVVTHGKTGLVLDDAIDPAVRDVYAGLASLLSDTTTLKEMGDAALADAAPKFLIENVIDRTARLFAHLGERHP